jgi:anti-sigma factor RsiW
LSRPLGGDHLIEVVVERIDPPETRNTVERRIGRDDRCDAIGDAGRRMDAIVRLEPRRVKGER